MIILVEYNDKQSWTLIQDVQTDVEDSSLEETFTLITDVQLHGQNKRTPDCVNPTRMVCNLFLGSPRI